ncbi:MAG: response regulator [Cytophagales bacterium]|nr:MAG: response regulator [Cytophagales bacterium]
MKNKINQALALNIIEETTITWQTNAKGEFIHVNKNFCQLLLTNEIELLSKKMDIENEQDFTKENNFFTFLPNKLKSFQNTNTAWHCELKLKTKYGASIYLDTAIYVLTTNEINQYLFVAKDITRQKSFETSLVYTQNFFYELFNHIPFPIFLKDEQSNFFFCNTAFLDLMHIQKKEILNQPNYYFLSEKEAKQFAKRDQWVMEKNASHEAEEEFTDPTGRRKKVIIKRSIFTQTTGNKILIGIIQDITMYKLAEKRLAETNNFIESITRAVPGLIYIFDFDKRQIVYINKELTTTLGYGILELKNMGKNFFAEIIHPKDLRNTLLQFSSRRFTTDEVQQFECRLKTKNNEYLWFAIQHLPFKRKENSTLKQIIGTAQNITELKIKEQELTRTTQIAENLAHAKAQFLSMMSHEIRNPMNAVIGLTHLLLQEAPKPKQVGILNTLKFSAENLLALINDFLDFTKIEAGKIEIEKTDFNFRTLIQNIEQIFLYRTVEKGIDLEVKLDPDIPDMLIGDPVRLNQILHNLIGNAIKFTEKGKISFKIFLVAERENSLEINFEVIDTGIGIAQENLETIFDTFAQASKDITRRFGGTGLGLFITRKLLALQNSTIQVKSKLGVGSNFSFLLHFEKSLIVAQPKNLNKSMNEQILPKNQYIKKAKVLLVEDLDINRLIATKFLKQWGIEPDQANDGVVAIKKAKETHYDLILMDLLMPELDGYEATKQLRAMPQYAHTPIIALTASAMEEEKEKAITIGITDYITKPFNPNELYSKVIKYLNEQLKVKKTKKNIRLDLKDAFQIMSDDWVQQKKILLLLQKEIKNIEENFPKILIENNEAKIRQAIHNQKGLSGLFNTEALLQEMIDAHKILQTNHTDNQLLQKHIIKIRKVCKKMNDTIKKYLIDLEKNIQNNIHL